MNVEKPSENNKAFIGDCTMRAAWIFAYNSIDRIIPNGLSLYLLGAGLLAAGLTQFVAATDAYYGYRIEMGLALMSLMLANCALAAVIVANALRRSSALAARIRGDRLPTIAFRFIHFAAAAHAALVLTFLLPLLQTLLDGCALPFLSWTSLSGAALILALLSGLRWDARFAVLGAVVSVAAFGCAVVFAPTIYGWDLRPMGWYAILVAAIPVLAFFALFLRRAPVFSASRWRRGGMAAALFAALVCAVALHMAANPADRFSASLNEALDGGASEIRFSDLTDFEWDVVEIYIPYTFDENLSPAARESADIVSKSRLGFNNRIDFMAFLKDEEIVYYEAVSHDNHTFDYPHPDWPYPWTLRREDAVFTVYRGVKRHTLALDEQGAD